MNDHVEAATAHTRWRPMKSGPQRARAPPAPPTCCIATGGIGLETLPSVACPNNPPFGQTGMPDLSYRQKHRSQQHLTGRVAVDCDRMTHGWFDRWLSNGDTYCKRAAWAWEIEQAAWRATTISLRGVDPFS